MTNAANTARSAAQAVDAARTAQTLSEQTFDAEQQRFRVGSSTNLNVMRSIQT